MQILFLPSAVYTPTEKYSQVCALYQWNSNFKWLEKYSKIAKFKTFWSNPVESLYYKEQCLPVTFNMLPIISPSSWYQILNLSIYLGMYLGHLGPDKIISMYLEPKMKKFLGRQRFFFLNSKNLSFRHISVNLRAFGPLLSKGQENMGKACQFGSNRKLSKRVFLKNFNWHLQSSWRLRINRVMLCSK